MVFFSCCLTVVLRTTSRRVSRTSSSPPTAPCSLQLTWTQMSTGTWTTQTRETSEHIWTFTGTKVATLETNVRVVYLLGSDDSFIRLDREEKASYIIFLRLQPASQLVLIHQWEGFIVLKVKGLYLWRLNVWWSVKTQTVWTSENLVLYRHYMGSHSLTGVETPSERHSTSWTSWKSYRHNGNCHQTCPEAPTTL